MTRCANTTPRDRGSRSTFSARTDGPMAEDIPLDKARPAQFVFTQHVEQKLAELRKAKGGPERLAAAE